jgi:hypothetical protein
VRRLVDLDDTARKVPVRLVGEVAEQHPTVVVTHQHLGDGPLAGEEGVEHRPEPTALVERCVALQPSEHHPVAPLAVVLDRAPHDALTLQPGPGGDPGGERVVGVDERLDPRLLELVERDADLLADRLAGHLEPVLL